jgi:hypothetical protein
VHAWDAHAEAIRQRLLTVVTPLKTCLLLQDAETTNNPASLPSAYVVMARASFSPAGGNRSDVATTWQVLVRSKHMDGVGGVLALVDDVLDALTGFQPAAGIGPLQPVQCEYFGEAMRPEPAYVITFTSSVDQIPPVFFTTC